MVSRGRQNHRVPAAPASRHHRRRRQHSAAAATQILNRPVRVNVQSSEFNIAVTGHSFTRRGDPAPLARYTQRVTPIVRSTLEPDRSIAGSSTGTAAGTLITVRKHAAVATLRRARMPCRTPSPWSSEHHLACIGGREQAAVRCSFVSVPGRFPVGSSRRSRSTEARYGTRKGGTKDGSPRSMSTRECSARGGPTSARQSASRRCHWDPNCSCGTGRRCARPVASLGRRSGWLRPHQPGCGLQRAAPPAGQMAAAMRTGPAAGVVLSSAFQRQAVASSTPTANCPNASGGLRAAAGQRRTVGY